MYLEADVKVTKMYRKGEMRRKKCKEREKERRGGGGGQRSFEFETKGNFLN